MHLPRPRLLARVGLTALTAAFLLGLTAAAAAAHEDHVEPDGGPADSPAPAGADRASDGTPRQIVVVEVSGLIDPIVAAYIKQQLTAAVGRHALGVVFQLNSAGTTLDDAALVDLARTVRLAHLPVGVWVGPSGAQALGGAAHLVTAADYAAIAPGGRIGEFTAVLGLRHAHGPDPDATHSHDDSGLHTGESPRHLDAQAAASAGLTQGTAPTVGEFILSMSDAGLLADITQTVTGDDGLVRRAPAPDVVVSFAKLPLLDGLFHAAASPALAFLLLLAGLSLLLVDFYTGGIGIAAALGAVCLLAASFGLGTLDIRPWALLALIAAFVAFAVDMQTGVPRLWTAVGGVLLAVGSLTLFGQHSMSWIPLVVGLTAVAVFVLSGMPALVRTRYGTATIGREWMLGASGTAVTDVDPDGTVEVHGAQWRARVNRLTPLRAGEPLRVCGISGVVLEVEPPEGGAVDYRQLRAKRAEPAAAGSFPKPNEV